MIAHYYDETKNVKIFIQFFSTFFIVLIKWV